MQFQNTFFLFVLEVWFRRPLQSKRKDFELQCITFLIQLSRAFAFIRHMIFKAFRNWLIIKILLNMWYFYNSCKCINTKGSDGTHELITLQNSSRYSYFPMSPFALACPENIITIPPVITPSFFMIASLIKDCFKKFYRTYKRQGLSTKSVGTLSKWR